MVSSRDYIYRISLQCYTTLVITILQLYIQGIMHFKVKQCLVCAVLATVAISAATARREIIGPGLTVPHSDIEKKDDMSNPGPHTEMKANFCKHPDFENCISFVLDTNVCCKPASVVFRSDRRLTSAVLTFASSDNLPSNWHDSSSARVKGKGQCWVWV